jgi:hypothetical protein
LRVPAPVHPYYRANSDFSKDPMRYGGTGATNSIKGMKDPNFGAVGYESGATKPKFSRGKGIISGTPTQSKAQSGTISTNAGPDADAREQRLMRSMAKIGLGRAYQDHKTWG